MKMKQEKIRLIEGEYKSDEEDKDFLIPVINSKHINTNQAIDKQKLMLAMSENVFCEENKHSILQNNLWRLNDSVTRDQINLFNKKLQLVTNIITESQRDIIVCSTICVIIVILQYIISSISFSSDGLGMTTMAFGGVAGQ